MKPSIKLSELAQVLDAQLIGQDVEVDSFSTDSRTIEKSQVFVALIGKNFDGHNFIDQVVERGVVVLVVSKAIECSEKVSQLVVKDTLLAYGALASFYAQKMPARKVAITGSCGKTTVKEMLSSVLAQRGKVYATQGNLNNEIGVPKTLLSISQDDEFAVIEMGASHAGDIAYLSSLVRADVVSILNADRAHLEGFGSVDGVAHAKGEIFSGAKSSALAVLLNDEKYFALWCDLVSKHGLSLVTCSTKDHQSDVSLLSFSLKDQGSEIEVNVAGTISKMFLPFLGEHNVRNALIVISIAHSLGLNAEEIRAGLALAKPEKGRLVATRASKKYLVIDDTYNANPLSVRAAIDVLSQYSETKVLVLGDMGELGDDAESLHQEVGEYAKKKNIDVLLSNGELSKNSFQSFSGDGESYANQQELIDALPQWLKGNESKVFLVKGSRYTAMENVVSSLMELGEAA